MAKLRVAIIAPPWLDVPPKGYGGIEEVLHGLIIGLKRHDVEVTLFGVGTTKIRGVKVLSLYKTEQYQHIHKPMYEALPILSAHIQFALNTIKADGKYDIIHDHNGFIGPQLLAWASYDRSIPPIVHTLHGPPFSNQHMLDQGLPDNKVFWKQLSMMDSRAYLIGISNALMKSAPSSLRPHILKTVYNAVDVNDFIFQPKKKNYFFTLARFSRDKGQHIAAQLCVDFGYTLKMAGTVAGIGTNRQLVLELSNPLSPYRYNSDFRYYSDKILPFTIYNKSIRYLGNVSGKAKQTLISNAKALLFPIDWEEPFGMAVIEALASGTPVIAMNRGAMSEIIQHGVNGFLANSEAEFGAYMKRIDEIDPAECRRSVESCFSADKMALEYIDRYEEVIKRSKKAR